MSSDEFAIRARDVSKHYVMFARPEDRLKQMIVPRLQRAIGRAPTRYFRDFAALNNVSFDIRRGETVGIIGRNGSGKSTLLQIVCGTLQPTSGSIEVNGRIAALLELGAGFNPEFTGRENVYLNAAILGLPRAEIDERFESIARFADIGDFIEQPVKTYSSGMYVRLAFATAINVDPDILVVDEALAVGDEAFQRKCFARIEQIKERGGTILFVSHGAQTIVQLCDRAMLIDAGEKILDGTPKLITNQYQRLVSAGPETARNIRSAILLLQDTAQASGATPTTNADRQKADTLTKITASETKTVATTDLALPNNAPSAEQLNDISSTLNNELSVTEYYDPNFAPQSTTYLEDRGARIRDIRVTTISGAQVNILQMGKRYIFRYNVDFKVDTQNAGFGMLIRTTEGVGIGGIQTIKSRTQRVEKIFSGQTIDVQMEFSNLLLPRTYFISCGVFGTVDSTRILMHRVIDAIMISVRPEANLAAIGLVDFNIFPQIAVVGADE